MLTGIWRSLPPEAAAGGVSVPTLLTYSAVAAAAGPLLGPQTTLSVHIANGSLSVRLLWPMGVVSQFVSEMLGSVLPATALTAAAVAGAAVLFDVPLAPAGPPPLFLVSLLLAVAAGVAVDFWFALLTVHLGSGIWLVNSIRAACTSVLSGALIPFSVMPWHIGDVLALLPFAAMASGPLRVYTQETGAAGLIAFQAGWAVLLWLGLARRVRASRDKVVGFGG